MKDIVSHEGSQCENIEAIVSYQSSIDFSYRFNSTSLSKWPMPNWLLAVGLSINQNYVIMSARNRIKTP